MGIVNVAPQDAWLMMHALAVTIAKVSILYWCLRGDNLNVFEKLCFNHIQDLPMEDVLRSWHVRILKGCCPWVVKSLILLVLCFPWRFAYFPKGVNNPINFNLWRNQIASNLMLEQHSWALISGVIFRCCTLGSLCPYSFVFLLHWYWNVLVAFQVCTPNL